MAYQKLQGRRAIDVVPNDDVIIPGPGSESVSGTTDGSVANKLVDSTANFTGKVKMGATVYAANQVATVTSVSQTELGLSANIAQLVGVSYVVYNISSEGPVLFVGTGGDLNIETVGGDDVLLKNLNNASFIPIMVNKVKATSTTCADIIAIW